MTFGLIFVSLIFIGMLWFKSWLGKSVRAERAATAAQEKPRTISSDECKALIQRGFEIGTLLRFPGSLQIGASTNEVWQTIHPEIREFLEVHGRVSWESGGFLGGSIPVRPLRSKEMRITARSKQIKDPIVLGCDESVIFFVQPHDPTIYAVDALLERLDAFANIYEAVVTLAAIDE